ncbi:MAG TPA: cupredoxin domain-containing protein [Kofleriaceae bacterium]|nr:cupredoxin domain-containing protein [Kofleriaceae bacterium]
MSLRVVAGLALVLGISGCPKKQEDAPAAKPAPAAPAAPAVSADGSRKVPIDVGKEGYVPARIPGKPGEKLTLVFTRRADGHCFEELKTPEGKLVMLPKDKPVEIPVTVPKEGEVRFACGMDMLEGFVVAEKS